MTQHPTTTRPTTGRARSNVIKLKRTFGVLGLSALAVFAVRAPAFATTTHTQSGAPPGQSRTHTLQTAKTNTATAVMTTTQKADGLTHVIATGSALINDTTKTIGMFSATTSTYSGDATAAAVNTHTVINHSAIRGAPSSPATIASAQATSFNSTISAIMTAIRDRAAQPTILVAVSLVSAAALYASMRRRSAVSGEPVFGVIKMGDNRGLSFG